MDIQQTPEASTATDPTPATDLSAEAPDARRPRDAANWAQTGVQLRVAAVPRGAVNLNVDGKSVVSPLQGFGKMWQKTYRIALRGIDITPAEVIGAWKANFQMFWPRGNRFYAPITDIAPGEVALINAKVGGMPLSTGILVLYADDESFTFMTPQGHVFAGLITFSAERGGDRTVAQVQLLLRANDPIYELGMAFGGGRGEDTFWRHTLTMLARHVGVTGETVEMRRACVDRRRQWRSVGNIWHNAAVRTTLTAPTRWFRRRPRG